MKDKSPRDTWDTSIIFGVGHQKEDHHSGFHKDKEGNGVFTGFVWRGDSREPDVVFDKGFKVDNSGVEKSGRITGSTPSISQVGTTRGVISTSELMSEAANWAVKTGVAAGQTQGWLYLIGIENEEWAASALANAGDNQVAIVAADRQSEIMLLEVKPTSIIAARSVEYQVDATGKVHLPLLTGDVIKNLDYVGPSLPSHFKEEDFGFVSFYKISDTSSIPNMQQQVEIIEKEKDLSIRRGSISVTKRTMAVSQNSTQSNQSSSNLDFSGVVALMGKMKATALEVRKTIQAKESESQENKLNQEESKIGFNPDGS